MAIHGAFVFSAADRPEHTDRIDPRGEACAGTDEPVYDCVVTTVDTHGRYAYATQCVPWTGNEGGTADKWYHQAALVVIPRRSPLHEEVVQPLENEATASLHANSGAPLQIRKRRSL